jgi:uncharacterized protein (TIGR01777 family)
VRVLVTGATGFIGAALGQSLERQGHEFIPLRRGPAGGWDADAGRIDRALFRDIDAVVHLAGESIGGRWTRAKKRAILESRVEGTRLIAQAVADAGVPVFVCGSAIGIYGDRGDEVLTEGSVRGSGFLADVVAEWEAAAAPAMASGSRTVFLRTGLVVDASGGSFPRMLLPFRLGVGGPIGRGSQWWSWITLEDEVRAITHVLADPTISGSVNLTAPEPVRNRRFVETLGSVLGRPSVVPAPSFALRAALGSEFAEEVLLSSQRVIPQSLLDAGFVFHHPTVGAGLLAAVGNQLQPAA